MLTEGNVIDEVFGLFSVRSFCLTLMHLLCSLLQVTHTSVVSFLLLMS